MILGLLAFFLGLFFQSLALKFRVDEHITSSEIARLVLEADLGVPALLAVDSLDDLGVLVAVSCDHGCLSDLHLLVFHELQEVLSLFICHYSVLFLPILINWGLVAVRGFRGILLGLGGLLIACLGGYKDLLPLLRSFTVALCKIFRLVDVLIFGRFCR